ncbi:MAG: hypothetical protein EBR34_16575 [Sphingomonadaceae bacterium]|nr:hypothetical protein [Sphingomonadaceae bacterium]
MPYNGSGTFAVLTPPYPFVTGTTISASEVNSVLADMATNGLTNAVTRDGQSPLTANWIVGGYNITGVATLGATTLNISGTATVGTLAITTLSATTLTISGNGTVGGTLGVTGAITGSSTITAATGLTVSAGGVTVTGASTITGTLGGLTGLTMASGLINASSSGIKFSDNTTMTTAATAYTPTGTLGTPLNASFPVGSGVFITKAGTATTGAGGDVTVTFAAAFPNACVAIIPALQGAPPNTNTYAFVTSKSASSAVLSAQSDGGNPRGSVPLTWIAVGY